MSFKKLFLESFLPCAFSAFFRSMPKSRFGYCPDLIISGGKLKYNRHRCTSSRIFEAMK